MLHSLKTTITYTPSLYRKYSLCFLFIVDIFIIFYSEWLWCWWNSVTVLLCLTGHQQLVMRCGFYSLLKAELSPILGFNCSIYSGCYGLSHQHYPISLLFQNHFPVFTCMFRSIHGIQVNQIQISGMFWSNFDICLISFYFISIYCYDCLNTNLLIHFFSILVACHYVLILDLLLNKLWGKRWDLTRHVYPL